MQSGNAHGKQNPNPEASATGRKRAFKNEAFESSADLTNLQLPDSEAVNLRTLNPEF